MACKQLSAWLGDNFEESQYPMLMFRETYVDVQRDLHKLRLRSWPTIDRCMQQGDITGTLWLATKVSCETGSTDCGHCSCRLGGAAASEHLRRSNYVQKVNHHKQWAHAVGVELWDSVKALGFVDGCGEYRGGLPRASGRTCGETPEAAAA